MRRCSSATAPAVRRAVRSVDNSLPLYDVVTMEAALGSALDGTLARLLKASSDFGAELDSLSDVIAFGVAPALVIYHWTLHQIGGFGWAVALVAP